MEITLDAMTGVVAEAAPSSEPCEATDGWVVQVGRMNVFWLPPSGMARVPTAATAGRM